MTDYTPSPQEAFDQFWKLYPRKIAKKHALQMWKRLTKAQQDKALETIGNHWKPHPAMGEGTAGG